VCLFHVAILCFFFLALETYKQSLLLLLLLLLPLLVLLQLLRLLPLLFRSSLFICIDMFTWVTYLLHTLSLALSFSLSLSSSVLAASLLAR
jgi:hypothetical protein